MKTPLTFAYEETLNLLHSNYTELQTLCNKDNDIAEFVRLVCCNRQYNNEFYSIEDIKIGNVLVTFVYDLGYDIQRNQFHSSSFISNLISFIGNYFLDDAYFTFEEESTPYKTEAKKWKCINKPDDSNSDDFTCIAMINKAKENVEFYKQAEHWLLNDFRNILNKKRNDSK